MAGAVSANGLGSIQTADGNVAYGDSGDSVYYNLTTAGTYTLTGDITESGSNETLIVISADNVILNGGGHTLDGGSTASTGIRVTDGCGSITITNFGNITHIKNYGVYVPEFTKSTLSLSQLTIGDIGDSSCTGQEMIGLCICPSGNAFKSVEISDCIFSGAISGGNTTIGIGLFCGESDSVSSLTINDCMFSGSITATGTDSWGGAIYVYSYLPEDSRSTTTIRNCHVSGPITIEDYWAFGIAAQYDSEGDQTVTTIKDCTVTGQITCPGNYVYGVFPAAKTVIVDNITVTGMNPTGSNRVIQQG
ncbi:MAG: hypothetical protein O0X49_07180, partial [Methanocorpusculum sp.]|nr:hypothetical protein [Methanocorpusculum sp.]